MLKIDFSRWNQSAEAIRDQALGSEHPRTRERWMALYEICIGKNATKVGTATGRNPQTVMEWVHRYNDKGPEAMVFKQTGGPPPLLGALPWSGNPTGAHPLCQKQSKPK